MGGKDDYWRLSTWRNDRRVVIVRSRLSRDAILALEDKQEGQQAFGFLADAEDIRAFEYAVLVTTLNDEVIGIVRHNRDRADCENNFDEIKTTGAGADLRQRILNLVDSLLESLP